MTRVIPVKKHKKRELFLCPNSGHTVPAISTSTNIRSIHLNGTDAASSIASNSSNLRQISARLYGCVNFRRLWDMKISPCSLVSILTKTTLQISFLTLYGQIPIPVSNNKSRSQLSNPELHSESW